jgi:uncharacterized membrane protein
MKIEHFLSQVEHHRIVGAIGEAEKRTSGEIRVWVSHRKIKDALAAAQNRFLREGMHKTVERNGVLVYIAPRTRVFAVIGDTGVHEKCGDKFWQEVTTMLSADLKRESITQAIINAVRKIGDLLAAHFPTKPGDRKAPADDLLSD